MSLRICFPAAAIPTDVVTEAICCIRGILCQPLRHQSPGAFISLGCRPFDILVRRKLPRRKTRSRRNVTSRDVDYAARNVKRQPTSPEKRFHVSSFAFRRLAEEQQALHADASLTQNSKQELKFLLKQ